MEYQVVAEFSHAIEDKMFDTLIVCSAIDLVSIHRALRGNFGERHSSTVLKRRIIYDFSIRRVYIFNFLEVAESNMHP